MEQKTHWKKQHNYNFLGAYSLPVGKDIVLTIKELKPEEIVGNNGKKEKGFVCHFEENQKPMILNKTNCKIIEKLYASPFIEDWIGKKIQLYVAQVSAFGTTTDALRVRDFKPEVQKIDNKEALKVISSSKTFSELQLNYNSLSKEMMADKEVLEKKDKMKAELMNGVKVK